MSTVLVRIIIDSFEPDGQGGCCGKEEISGF
jgi:hypothetical protein